MLQDQCRAKLQSHELRTILDCTPEIMAVILTLAVMDRQGRGPREHRQQAGGAPKGILTAAVWPRSETENRRSPAGFPLPCGILHGGQLAAPPWGFRPPHRHPVPGGFDRQEQDGDTENRDGYYCTRRTLPTPPAPFGAGFLVGRGFPLGWRRPSGGRPPAQRETQNNRGGLLTAQRYSGGSSRHRGYRGRRESE
ncbi:hypothetical protein NDU88_004955 [Pleurodeles waltl]|uniref:Uncharacterized protein n=1 Tax=Pleurodeles waltl TaxID=8319 RepID=A0AAV7WWX5_PLEWA|nr:hypothetical protein NDU88_004955 [Pleurodeles waltl]